MERLVSYPSGKTFRRVLIRSNTSTVSAFVQSSTVAPHGTRGRDSGSGARIVCAREKNVSTLFPHGFHTVGVVFSTEMDST